MDLIGELPVLGTSNTWTLSVQSRIDKEGVIFDPLFTDLGVIW